jgi:D-alanyl-D-alanine carboxypeptidase
VLSTSPDLARWALALYGGERVLSVELREEMLRARPAPRVGPGNAYGLGVIVGSDGNGPRWGHTGWYPGYGTALAYYPRAGLALALQLNTDDPALRAGFPDGWVEALAAVLLAGD